MDRIEELIGALAKDADPASLRRAQELVAAILDLHKEGLERALELIGAETSSQISRDPLVARLLVLHELHPQSVEERLQAVLSALAESLSPRKFELVSLSEGAAAVRVSAEELDGPAWNRLRARVEGALSDAAPELVSVQIERVHQSFVPVSNFLGRRSSAADA